MYLFFFLSFLSTSQIYSIPILLDGMPRHRYLLIFLDWCCVTQVLVPWKVIISPQSDRARPKVSFRRLNPTQPRKLVLLPTQRFDVLSLNLFIHNLCFTAKWIRQSAGTILSKPTFKNCENIESYYKNLSCSKTLEC